MFQGITIDLIRPVGTGQEGFITAIESTIMANCEFRSFEFPSTPSIIPRIDVVTMIVSVVATVVVNVVVVKAVVVGNVVVTVVGDAVVVIVANVVAVVAVVTVVLPEAASAFLVLSVASIKETTGGVTTANRPHCSKKERRSAFSRSLSW